MINSILLLGVTDALEGMKKARLYYPSPGIFRMVISPENLFPPAKAPFQNTYIPVNSSLKIISCSFGT